ncbi:TrmH family RNA methyltransferase [Candidatus Nitrospira bockiana]
MALPALPAGRARLIRDLARHKKTRDVEQAFVLEGSKAIRELLTADPLRILSVVLPLQGASEGSDLIPLLRQARISAYTCPAALFDTLSGLSTSAGLLAVVKQPAWNAETVFSKPFLLGVYGDGLQDPTNVGTLIRTSLAFEVDALWLSEDSADVYNPKVVRATAGAVLRLPIFRVSDASVFEDKKCTLLTAEVAGPHTCAIQALDVIPPRAVLCLGNEGRGLRDDVRRRAAVRFHIPISEAVESLNVAAAAAISLYHVQARRRRAEAQGAVRSSL